MYFYEYIQIIINNILNIKAKNNVYILYSNFIFKVKIKYNFKLKQIKINLEHIIIM